jgi:hypothetical protein
VDWIRRDKRPMTVDELNYFGKLKSNILNETNSDEVAIMMECYRQAGVKVLD